MKTLAWILVVFAIAGSVALGINWAVVRPASAAAQACQRKYAEDADSWRYSAALKRQSQEMAVGNDRLRLQSDDTEIEIANLKGIGLAKATAARSLDQARLRGDEDTIRYRQMAEDLGPDPNVAQAEERASACAQSVKVYAASLARDHEFFYAVGVLWLAFGFAAAFAAQKKAAG